MGGFGQRSRERGGKEGRKKPDTLTKNERIRQKVTLSGRLCLEGGDVVLGEVGVGRHRESHEVLAYHLEGVEPLHGGRVVSAEVGRVKDEHTRQLVEYLKVGTADVVEVLEVVDYFYYGIGYLRAG